MGTILRLLLFGIFFFCASLALGQKNGRETGWGPDEPAFGGQKIPAGGIQIHFVEVGQGPPLILLHGLGGSWIDWAANLRSFGLRFRAVAIDFPGFGNSDKPEADYSVEWLTQIVDRFLQERKLNQVYLVGHSMGALVAMNLAAQPDSRVKKLVVVDAVGIGDKAEFLSYALTKKIMGPNSRWSSVEEAMKDELRSMIDSFIKKQKPKTSKEFFQSLPKIPFSEKSLVPMTPSVQMSASIIDFDVHSKLSLIRQPTLILWGAKDPVAPPQDAAILKNKIPHAALTILDGCGHSPMQEQPARFNREVEQFLQAAESGSSR